MFLLAAQSEDPSYMLSVITCVQEHILVNEVFRTGLDTLALDANDGLIRHLSSQERITSGSTSHSTHAQRPSNGP